MERFGENMLVLRKQKGMSQEKLARQCDLSLNSVHRLETGRTVPGLDSAVRIAAALGCKVDDLVGKREVVTS